MSNLGPKNEWYESHGRVGGRRRKNKLTNIKYIQTTTLHVDEIIVTW